MLKRLTKEKLDEILESAVDEFAANGPDKASVNVIAQKAGVSVGVLYKYYENKDALFTACVEYALQVLEEAIEESFQDDESFFEAAGRMVRMALKSSRERPNYHVLYHEITAGGCRRYTPALAKRIESVSSSAYSRLVERAQKDGEVRDDLDPRIIAFFFDNLLVMLQFSYSCEYYKERLRIYCGDDVMRDDERMANELLGFLRAACCAKKD